jgi:hypothetical protein
VKRTFGGLQDILVAFPLIQSLLFLHHFHINNHRRPSDQPNPRKLPYYAYGAVLVGVLWFDERPVTMVNWNNEQQLMTLEPAASVVVVRFGLPTVARHFCHQLGSAEPHPRLDRELLVATRCCRH